MRQTLRAAIAVAAVLLGASATWAAEAAPARRIEVRGEWLYVDGEPFLVKGVGYSPYRPGQVPWKDTVDLGLVERDFQRIVEGGFNTLRTWAPLSDEALRLADRYGLFVLQGIWIERDGSFATPAFRQAMLEVVRREATRASTHPNVLALLIGNELLPAQVFETGVPETEELLRRGAEAAREADPHRLTSYANWPALVFLDSSPWDFVSFNLYPYEPASVAHAFGLPNYVRHLKRTLAQRKPLLVTEVGLSLAQRRDGETGPAGYGGHTTATRPAALLALWDGIFQAGAQGAVVFEWNDEWWKQAEHAGDERTHEPEDPEEWFGLVEFQDAGDGPGRLRPDYAALQSYNQAVLLSPVEGRTYDDQLQVTVYATERVGAVRFRLGRGGWWKPWTQATRLSRHWWKATVPLTGSLSPGVHPLVVEALDARGRRLARQERRVRVREALDAPVVQVTTDRSLYEVGQQVETVRYAVQVTDGQGAAAANRTVLLAVAEPQSSLGLTTTATTDAQGRVEGTYLVREPGFVVVSAATPVTDGLRVGDEAVALVRQQVSRPHAASTWEAGVPEGLRKALRHEATAFALADAGTESVVDYARYGSFVDRGTASYRYDVTDWTGLAEAVGEGIYPNEGGLLRDPAFTIAQASGVLDGSHWDMTFLKNIQHSFFKWASTDEEPGVKQFYTALTLERASLWAQAIKAYYAALMHYPTSVGWTAFDPPTPWYVGKVARDKIEAILRLHPELGQRLEGAFVRIEGGFDHAVDNDRILADPGRLVPVAVDEVNPPPVDLSGLAVRRTVGRGRVRLVQYENSHWRLLVDGTPWVVRGLTFQPSQVGETPDEGSLRDWMTTDRNGNSRIDAFDTFVDANGNNRQDAGEPVIGDFALLRDMGVNTLRLYHHASNKHLLRQLHREYGLMFMLGDFVGMYTVGSGATWEEGTDYLNLEQRKRMTESVKQLVREHKDEPYVLMWVLGNENNYGGVHGIVGGVGNAGKYPREYYRFLNELATWIHGEDPDHPVAIANGDAGFLDLLAEEAPAVDIFGSNLYRGWQGAGRSFYEDARRMLDKPVLVTEFGCPAFQTGEPREVAERDQALYHFGNWVDIADNLAGRGQGNALGGVVFEWSDEWWKAGQPPRFSPRVQETVPNWAGPYPGGWNFEEWYGLVSQGDGAQSPYLRQLRASYELYKGLWNPTASHVDGGP